MKTSITGICSVCGDKMGADSRATYCSVGCQARAAGARKIKKGACGYGHPITGEESLTVMGPTMRCRECERTRAEEDRKHNPERWLLIYARQRAKINNLPFSITAADIHIPEFCPILGIKLEHQTGKGVKAACSPSLDKIIPELGYVPGNVVVISMRANAIKNDATLSELTRVGEWAKKKLDSEKTS